MAVQRRNRPSPGIGEPGLPGTPVPGLGEIRPKKKVRRRKYTDKQKCDYVTLYKKSGETQAEFCAEHGINVSCLIRWRRELGDTARPRLRKSTGKKRGPRPHRVFTPEDRRRAIEAFKDAGLSLLAFGRTWGVSANSLSEWMRRYDKHGPKGLEPRPRKRSRDPHPRALPRATKDAIVETKRKNPEFGLRKIRDTLLRFVGIRVSAGSVAKTLREAQIPPLPGPRKRPRRKKMPPRRFERARPGQLWQSDITSFLLKRHSQRVYLTVFMDDHSRYIVSFGLHLHQKQDIVIEALLEGCSRFGKPEEVLTDQGRQYFAWRGKSKFQKVLIREGIEHVVSRTHHPQTLGKCERFWGTVGREFWERVEPQDLASARERLSHFIAHYNHFRPHQGISGMVPADRFFSATNALRQTLEAQMSKHELDLALSDPPRRPVYLFGQIGDQQVSLHGEKGRLVIQTPERGREEMKLEELGVEAKARMDGMEAQHGRAGARKGPGPGSAEGKNKAPFSQAGALEGAEQDASSGTCALGGGDGRGAQKGPQDVRGDPRVLAWAHGQSGSDDAVGTSSAEGLAALAAGPVGYAGGAVEAAENSGEASHAKRSGVGSQALAKEDRAAGTGAEPGAGRDQDLARVTGEPVAAPAQEQQEEGSWWGKKGAGFWLHRLFKKQSRRCSRVRDDSGGVTTDGSPRGSE